MSLSSRTHRFAAAIAATVLGLGIVHAPLASADVGAGAGEAAAPGPVEATVDYFADSYAALGAGSVFVSAPFEYLKDILNSTGTYAVVLGGPQQESTQNAIHYIDKKAKEHGIAEVYHFDPLLAGDDLDITDPVNSVAYGSNTYYKLFTDIQNLLVNSDAAYTDSSATYVFVYQKGRQNSAGDLAPIIAGVVESSAQFASQAEIDAYEDELDAVFASADDENGDTTIGTRSQFDYFRTTHTAFGNDQAIVQEVDRQGWTLKTISYPELIHLLESPGSHTIVTGNGWCPNARAVYRFLNQAAIANGTKTVYVFDVRLDGSSSALSITQDLNRFNYLDQRLIDGYFDSASTDIDNPKLPYYPNGDTTQQQLVSKNRKFLNPFLFQWNKDATDAEGDPKPVTHQWIYEDANGPQEYQLVWSQTRDGIGTTAIARQGLGDLKDFFNDVGEYRSTLIPADAGDVPRQGRASNTAADGCGDEDDLIDNIGGEVLLPNSGTKDYDVAHYDIALEYTPVEPSSQTSVTATTKIRATAKKDLTKISLDARRFAISSVKVDGVAGTYQQVNFDSQDTQKLNITPTSAIENGQQFTVEISYTTGTVDAFKRAGQSNQGFFPAENSDGATALGQPFGSTYWFPNNNSTTDRATYTIALTAPESLTGVSNGNLVSTLRHDGKITRTWQVDTPTVPYQTVASFGDFKEIVRDYETKDGRTIAIRNFVDRTLYSKTSNQQLLEKQYNQQASILSWAEDRFGAYPGETAGTINETLLNADRDPIALGGVETNGRIFFSGVPGGNTFVHEYIHQWFGNAVGIASYDDLWLNEGFATYLANLYYEDNAGLALDEQYRAWFAANTEEEFWNVAPGSLTQESELFSNAVYGRGGYVLAALRVSIGVEAFDRLLTEWFAAKNGTSATTAEFVQLATEVAGRNLDRVLSTWLYGNGRPASFPDTVLSDAAPDAPAKPGIVVAGRSVTVSWQAPVDDGGSPVTGYSVLLNDLAPVEVGGATLSHTFTDLPGGTYSARVVASNAVGSSAPSVVSDQVTVPPQPPVQLDLGVVSISGSASIGSVLTASVSGSLPAGASTAYQWLRGGAPITGATSRTYTVTSADHGKVLAVRVTASAPGHEPASATSSATGLVAKVASSVTLTRSSAAQVFGSSKTVTLTATVAVPAGAAQGEVTFRSGKTVLGAATVKAGKATLKVKPTFKVATHRVIAEFVSSDAAVAGSTSKAVTLKVTKTKAKVTAKLAKKSVRVGTKGKVTVTIKATGVAKPTGKVVVYDGKKKIRTVTVKAKHGGKVTITLPKLKKGTHKIKVTYNGSTEVAKKTSKVVDLRVR